MAGEAARLRASRMASPPRVLASVAALKQQGDKAYAGRDFAAAIERYSEALEIAEDVVVLSNRSATHAQRRHFDKALFDAERALQLNADWPKLYHRKGHALFDLGRFDDAIEAFEAGLALDSTDVWLQEAAERARQYTERDPTAPPPAARAAPRPAAPRQRGGGAFSSRAPAPSPEDGAATGAAPSGEELRERGNDAFRQGKHSAAVKHYSDAIRANPKDAKAHCNRAAAQIGLLDEFGKNLPPAQMRINPYYENAMSDLTEALAIDSGYVKAWARKGQLHLKVGEIQQAMSAYQRGLQLDPDSPDCEAGRTACERYQA